MPEYRIRRVVVEVQELRVMAADEQEAARASNESRLFYSVLDRMTTVFDVRPNESTMPVEPGLFDKPPPGA